MKTLHGWTLAVILLLSATAVNAQNNTKHLLSKTDKSEYTSIFYEYNDDWQITHEQASDCYRDFTCDTDGRITRESTWQDVKNDGNFANVYYIEYDYDSQGRIAERRNFNNYKAGGKLSMPFSLNDENPMIGDFQLGSVTTYTYDDAGHISRSDIYWDMEKTVHAQFFRYEYNEKGNLEKKIQFLKRPAANIRSAEEQYRYDDDGRLLEIVYISYETNSGMAFVQNYRTFEYDTDGNPVASGITEADHNTYMTKQTYTYDTTDTRTAIYPYIPEDTDNNRLYGMLSRTIYSIDTYLQNSETKKLEQTGTQIFIYDNTPVESITITENSLTMTEGETLTIEATVLPANATCSELEWNSDNPQVATIDSNGTVTALMQGETLITASATDGSGVKAECTVRIEPHAGVDNANATNMRVGVQNNDIVISGLTSDETYRIINTCGQIIMHGKGGNEIRITNLEAGIYIISAAGFRHKVTVK